LGSKHEDLLSIINYESHGDEITDIPEGGEILAYSERTPIEIFAVGD